MVTRRDLFSRLCSSFTGVEPREDGHSPILLPRREILMAATVAGLSMISGCGQDRVVVGAAPVREKGKTHTGLNAKFLNELESLTHTDKEFLRYKSTALKLTELGLEIHRDLSKYSSGSDRTSIFLSDEHTPEYNAIQAQRITAIDGALNLSSIGLEGLFGDLDVGRLLSLKKLKDEWEPRGVVRNEKTDSLETKEDDSLYARVQKSYLRFLRDGCRGDTLFWESETFKQDVVAFRRESTGSGLMSEEARRCDVALKLLDGLEKMNFKNKNLLGQLSSDADLDSMSGQMITAVGMSYLPISTKAKKIGTEDKAINEKATAMVTANYYCMHGTDLDRQINGVNGMLQYLVSAYSSTSANQGIILFKNKLNEYLKELEDVKLACFRSANDALDSAGILDAALREEIKTVYLDGNGAVISLVVPRVVDRQILDVRSESWAKNPNLGNMPLVIGGIRHRDTFYSSAMQVGQSVITVMGTPELEERFSAIEAEREVIEQHINMKK